MIADFQTKIRIEQLKTETDQLRKRYQELKERLKHQEERLDELKKLYEDETGRRKKRRINEEIEDCKKSIEMTGESIKSYIGWIESNNKELNESDMYCEQEENDFSKYENDSDIINMVNNISKGLLIPLDTNGCVPESKTKKVPSMLYSNTPLRISSLYSFDVFLSVDRLGIKCKGLGSAMTFGLKFSDYNIKPVEDERKQRLIAMAAGRILEKRLVSKYSLSDVKMFISATVTYTYICNGDGDCRSIPVVWGVTDDPRESFEVVWKKYSNMVPPEKPSAQTVFYEWPQQKSIFREL